MHKALTYFKAITKPSIQSYVAASCTVFAACLVITLWSWNNARDNLTNDLQASLNNTTETIRNTIANSLNSYAEVLRGGAGLLAVNPGTTQQTWQQYIRNVEALNRYPGLQGVSYIQIVPSGELTTFLQQHTTANGAPYIISPDYAREQYALTRFSEPLTNRSLQTPSNDPLTDPVRSKAMLQARDTGQATITARTILMRDSERPQAGFVVYVPVYRPGAPINNTQERQAALQGYVAAGVRTGELIDGLVGDNLPSYVGLKIYDGTEQTTDQLIYASTSFQSLSTQPNLTSAQQILDKDTGQWSIVAVATPQVASATQRKQPQEILVTGLLFSILITTLLFIIMSQRAQAITDEKNKEVQEAKDSLISLASHQLRTPATGVKQFVGMVLEGYAGDISAEQRAMLDRAYQSNERQLEIINQILHVTRADSGRLVLHKEKLDINSLIRSIIDEYTDSLALRNQRITFRPGKTAMQLTADRQYLAMAVDNLISNASKYSHPNATIHIRTKQIGRNIIMTVRDSGVGIHSGDMHKLFQKFSRIDNELSIEAGGNGIGLYLCREIILLHKGTIDVDSSPDRGSTFTITLPRR